MDQYFPVHTVSRGGGIRALPKGRPLDPAIVRAYVEAEHLRGVLILQSGQIRAEQYAHGLRPATRWTSFSVTKAVTDTLAAAALQQGVLRSLDDDVTVYLPSMRSSAYEGVSIRQLMLMTSGVRWTESYTENNADNVLLYATPAMPGLDPILEYMRRLPRAAPPGTRWLYNTGETDLLGVLLRRATGLTLAEQLSRTVWRHAGMEHDATWIANAEGMEGEEFGGSGLSATLRDFGRFGLWVLEGGHGAVTPGWFAQTAQTQVPGTAAYSYGWWPQPDGSFAALGIFGQSILIDPKRQMVIVILGNWPQATNPAHSAARAAFWNTVKAKLDGASNGLAGR